MEEEGEKRERQRARVGKELVTQCRQESGGAM